MSLAQKVKYLRKDELKLTQKDFAEKCGVSRSYIGEIEAGRVVGNFNLISKLSDISGKPITYFVGSDDIQVKSYEVLDNIINSFISSGVISEDGSMDEVTEQFLLHTLKKEIIYKLSEMKERL